MNALDLCNACDVNEADPDNAAGYCADCMGAIEVGPPTVAEMVAYTDSVLDDE